MKRNTLSLTALIAASVRYASTLLAIILFYSGVCSAQSTAGRAVGRNVNDREFRPLTTDNGLSDQLVNVIFKDSRGFVWLGTGVGVDRFDGNNMVNYTFPETDGPPRRITAITEGNDGRVFIGSYSGLFEGDIYEAIDLVKCCEGRTSYGGPSEASVKNQIALAAAQLTAWEEKNA